MEQILDWDKKLLVFLNSYHADGLDPVVLLMTKTIFWLPLYLLLLYLIFKKFKGIEAWLILGVIAILIFISDQVTSTLMKPYFARLRPSHEPALQNIVHLVDGYTGGLYGFASGHAANTFMTATFFWLLFRDSYKWIIVIFLWALCMTYTRIYLGVHYPGDVLIGCIIGIVFGWMGFLFLKWIRRKLVINHSQKKALLSG